jgi:anaerobic selenocysteine-containing dehydrogenase
VEVQPFGHGPATPKLSLDRKPTTDELLELLARGSRIPLEQVKANDGGTTYPDDPIVVGPADPAATGRLHVGHPEMMRRLGDVLGSGPARPDASYPFRLLCRRNNHVYNTSSNVDYTHRDERYNPAYVNPADMADLSLAEGEQVVLTSMTGSIAGFVHADATLRRGIVSMPFGYGVLPDRDDDPRVVGTSPSRLLSTDQVFDPYTGQPRMTNVPIRIEAANGNGDG